MEEIEEVIEETLKLYHEGLDYRTALKMAKEILNYKDK